MLKKIAEKLGQPVSIFSRYFEWMPLNEIPGSSDPFAAARADIMAIPWLDNTVALGMVKTLHSLRPDDIDGADEAPTQRAG